MRKVKKIKRSERHERKLHDSIHLEMQNFEKIAEEDFKTGNGFVIKTNIDYSKLGSEELLSDNSIYSMLFDISDNDPASITKYLYICGRCKKTYGQENKGMICPYCGEEVQKQEFSNGIRGWIKSDYKFMSPVAIERLEKVVGKKVMTTMLSRGKYKGFLIMNLYERWHEFIETFGAKNKKSHNYKNLMEIDINTVFSSYIPVISKKLRFVSKIVNMDIDEITVHEMNAIYAKIARIVDRLKNDNFEEVWTNKRICEIQSYIRKLGEIIFEDISGDKDKLIRGSIFSMRVPYTGRLPIVPIIQTEGSHRIDVCRMNYDCFRGVWKLTLKELLLERGMPLHEILDLLDINRPLKESERRLLDALLLEMKKEGSNFTLVNREPVIDFPSVVSLEIIGLTRDYVLEISPSILGAIRGDHDGDVLTIAYLSKEICKIVHNAMCPQNYMLAYDRKLGAVGFKNDQGILFSAMLDD